MNWINLVYAFLSLSDAAVLIVWGVLDLRKGHTRDALFLMILGLCGLGAYAVGNYRDKALDTQIEVQKANVAGIQQSNLQLQLQVGREQDKRIAVENILKDFKTLTQYSDEALAGSYPSYNNLKRLALENSDLGMRAKEQVTYIQRELAYYEQPPGIVLALELSMTVNGSQVRLLKLSTQNLFKLLQDEKNITNNTRFSLMNDICQKPQIEVDRGALEVLRNSQYLPALAATTSILRRIHSQAVPFLDVTGWKAYLGKESL